MKTIVAGSLEEVKRSRRVRRVRRRVERWGKDFWRPIVLASPRGWEQLKVYLKSREERVRDNIIGREFSSWLRSLMPSEERWAREAERLGEMAEGLDEAKVLPLVWRAELSKREGLEERLEWLKAAIGKMKDLKR